jgi:hypothetical protein
LCLTNAPTISVMRASVTGLDVSIPFCFALSSRRVLASVRDRRKAVA